MSEPTKKTAPKNAVVWVAGGREYNNEMRVNYILDRYRDTHGIRLIVTGAATGTDQLAEKWARKAEISYHGIPAKWSLYSGGAGPRRNKEIAETEKPDVLIAFPGGSGTESAIRVAQAHGIVVYKISDGPA